jgi:hypothetical protein
MTRVICQLTSIFETSTHLALAYLHCTKGRTVSGNILGIVSDFNNFHWYFESLEISATALS